MHKVSLAVALLAEAENLKEIYQEVEGTQSKLEKKILEDMLDLRKRMQLVMGIQVSDKFADKFTFYYRYICDALYIEGKINAPY